MVSGPPAGAGPSPVTTSRREDRKAIPRDLAVFLVQFSIALSKTNTYPAGHPALGAAVRLLHQRLLPVFAERETLKIAVARRQLVVEGIATDGSNAILRELAQRLHRHQIGTVTFHRGAELPELGAVLEALGSDGWRRGKPLGAEPPETLGQWPHCRLQPLALDRLVLADSDDPATVVALELWLGLAAAVLHGGEESTGVGAGGLSGTDGTGLEDPDRLVSAIETRRGEASYDQAIVAYLTRLSHQLTEMEGEEAVILRDRLAELLEKLQPETLRALLEVGADLAQRKQLVLDASQHLPVHAILDLLQAAADASTRTISHALLRVLSKLAAHAESDTTIAPDADTALRDAVRQLVSDWTLDDPNPGSHRQVLELLSRRSRPSTAEEELGEADEAEAFRMVQMALELDYSGSGVLAAVDRIAASVGGSLPELLNLLDHQDAAPAASAALWQHLASPARVRLLLGRGWREEERSVIERLIAQLGLGAVGPLVDALGTANDLAIRRRLIDQLTALGPEAAPPLVAALAAAPWYLQRNILLVLGSLTEGWPPDFSPLPYAKVEELRLRREAIRLMLRHPEFRDQGIQLSLGDSDTGILQAGLATAAEGCPAPMVPLILNHLAEDELDDDLRTLGVRAIGTTSSVLARDWLVRRAQTRTRWLRRVTLRPRSGELLAILGVLRSRWPEHPAVVPVLTLARHHSDPDIRTAAGAAR